MHQDRRRVAGELDRIGFFAAEAMKDDGTAGADHERMELVHHAAEAAQRNAGVRAAARVAFSGGRTSRVGPLVGAEGGAAVALEVTTRVSETNAKYNRLRRQRRRLGAEVEC